MSIARLVKEGKIHRFSATKQEVDRALAVAERDLAVAEKTLETDADWCFSIAYNCVLQACRAYMFHKGYRPASFEAHKTVFEFMGIAVEKRIRTRIGYFDRVRKKRHRAVYDQRGVVSRKEAEGLLGAAKDFLSYVKSQVEN
jgi:uncharacterized protein (UPF0332 family)